MGFMIAHHCLGFRVSCHFGPVLVDIAPVVFEVAEQHSVFEEDGVVSMLHSAIFFRTSGQTAA